MSASYPTPDDQKVNRNPVKFDWVSLPAKGRKGRAPKLPDARVWTDETTRWWADLWKSPQATQWDQTGRTALPMAYLYEAIQLADPERVSSLWSELRQHQDRHGLNPKAMLQLRWRLVDEEGNARSQGPGKTPAQTRRERLQIVS